MSNYTIGKDDIDGMLHYLQSFHPELATKEFAEFYLHRFQENVQIKLDEIAGDLDSDPARFESLMEEIIEEFPEPKLKG